MTNNLVQATRQELVNHLWESDPRIKMILEDSDRLHDAREKLFAHLNGLERRYFSIYSDKHFKDLHIIKKKDAKECIKVLKNVIRTENESLTHFSALNKLFGLAKNEAQTLSQVENGFLCEFINLFKGINGKAATTADIFILPSDNKKASRVRSEKLDEYSNKLNTYLSRYRKGTDQEIIKLRNFSKAKILNYFGGSDRDWSNYIWHLKHTIRDVKTLTTLVKLEKKELEGVLFAENNRIPFEITPYYLSLFNEDGQTRADRTLRAQVLPSKTYCLNVIKNWQKHIDMDFMGEKSTSPVKGITRRYPQIVILKPLSFCPQICVYCQRNWELDPEGRARMKRQELEKAIGWIKYNDNISEVLVTGGDPLILSDEFIDNLLAELANIRHIERIRIGTRVLVTLPFRITAAFINILQKYHELGKREVCIITHFEHVSEITPEAIEAIIKLRNAGISIYNQQVFTYFNSLRFETCALRKMLKLTGIDPYYTFNTKGKAETIDFRVPIARIEQERKEESTFIPGIVRTDEPVFNVPKLGKSHLRAWQDHEVIMILSSGQRVYRFFPWESKVTLIDDYIYTDVAIYDYLKRLAVDGEDIDDYKSIWYYF